MLWFLVLVMTMDLTGTQLVFAAKKSNDSAEINQMQQQEKATQQQISNLEKQTQETQNAITNLQGQKAAAQNVVNSLENQSASLQAEVDEYEDQLADINADIKEAEDAMAEVSAKIVDLNNQLAEAEEQERIQYAALKDQTRSTYLSGGKSGILLILLSSGSVHKFLNTTQYVDALLGYNQKKLEDLRAVQETIKAKREEVEKEQKKIDEYQATLDEKQEEIADLTDEVMGNLDDTNSSLSTEKNKIANFNTQLANLDATMKALEAQVAAAQAELAKQIAARQAAQLAAGTKEYTGGSYAASASELQWLAATIQAEADGESYTGKLAVGSVIMNRVKSSSFPNSIKAVITQNMQFASYRSGKVELIISNGPNSTCLQAAQEVLDGARVGDYLFFMTKPYADYYGIQNYTMIGNHAFFYSWTTGGGGGGAGGGDEGRDDGDDDDDEDSREERRDDEDDDEEDDDDEEEDEEEDDEEEDDEEEDDDEDED